MPGRTDFSTESPPLGEWLDAGGRRLAVHRAGAARPVVVFAPGAGLVGLDYLNIQEAITPFAASILYDRAGTGWSEATRLPRSAAEAALELRAMLRAAGAAPPFVLVGHSLGGAYVRRFAQLFPEETGGIVFLDPAHEGYLTLPPVSPLAAVSQVGALLRAIVDMRGFYRPKFEAMLGAWPQPLRDRLVDYHLRCWRRSLEEARNLQSEVLDEICAGGPMPDAPTVVLTAMGLDPFMVPFMPAAYLNDLNRRKAAFYDAFAKTMPRGENRLVEGAGHSTLHIDRSDAVVAAIRDVVEAASGRRAALAAAA